MKKFLLVYLLLFQSFLFACAACQLMVPKVQVYMTLDFKKNRLKNTHISWKFTDTFVRELIRSYDENENDILDADELSTLKKVLLEYLVPRDMVTKISYSENINDDNETKVTPTFSNLELQRSKENSITFDYDAKMNLAISQESVLNYTFQDDEGYFDFVVENIKINKQPLFHDENLYLFLASIHFSPKPFISTQMQPKKVTQNTNSKSTLSQDKVVIQEQKVQSAQSTLLQKSILKVKQLFNAIKDDKNPLSYIMLLFFAYIYGVIHALGPGHGKTLVASYFMSHERSYLKALFVSLAIGVVHTFSAFLLTLIIYFMINTFMSNFLNNTVYYTTKISAIIIIAIALYLFYKKYFAYKALQQKSASHQFGFSKEPHVPTCACASCKVDNNATDLALIVSAGIIPCPGTITVFIFSLSLGLYVAGFASAVSMSLGMSTIIFFSAVLSVALRKKSLDNNTRLKKYLEYGSLGIILILGCLMLFA